MDRIAEILIKCYEYDVEVFSQPWIYYTVFPAFIYFAFFMLKWTALTAPIWIPIRMAIHAFRVNISKE